MDTQPWVSTANRHGVLWMQEVRLMLETAALGWSDIQGEIDLGYFRPSLIQEIEEMPHAGGWNAAAAERYAEIDRRSGFVKHAEVYRRKRQRAEALKRFEKDRPAARP